MILSTLSSADLSKLNRYEIALCAAPILDASYAEYVALTKRCGRTPMRNR